MKPLFQIRMLIRFVLGIIVFSNLPFYAVSQTAVCNINQTGTTRWLKSQSPYVLNCNLSLPSMATLIIEPGVEVKMNNKTLSVSGRLIAEGKQSDSIRFTDENTTAQSSIVFFSKVSSIRFASFGNLKEIKLSQGSTCSITQSKISSNTKLVTALSAAQGLDSLVVSAVSISSNINTRFGKAILKKFSANATYEVDYIDIAAPDTLVIRPGVTIRLATTSNIGNLRIQGTLLAVGTPTDSIRFVARSTDCTVCHSINIFGNNTDGTNKSSIQYAAFENIGRRDVQGRVLGGVKTYDYAKPVINHCSFQGSSQLVVNLAGATNLSNLSIDQINLDFYLPSTTSQRSRTGTLRKVNANTLYKINSYVPMTNRDTVQIEAGINIDLNSRHISIQGTLLALGKADQLIRFYSTQSNYSNVNGSLDFLEGSSSSMIRYCLFEKIGDNGSFAAYSGINIKNSSPLVENCRFEPTARLFCEFLGCKNLKNLDLSRVWLIPSSGFGKAQLPKLGKTIPYQLANSMSLSKNDTLVLSPGVDFQLGNYPMYISGCLKAEGTPQDSIRFSALPTSVLRVPIIFAQETLSSSIRYASFQQLKTGIYLQNPINLSHCSFYSCEVGITVSFSQFGQVLKSHNLRLKGLKRGINIERGIVQLSESDISNNKDYGIEVTTRFRGEEALAVALNCWWGSDSGPYHPKLNSAATGNRVSDRVVFDPWLKFSPLDNRFISISPSKGGASGTVTVNIFGSGFKANTRVKLSRAAENDITVADSLLIIFNNTRLQAVFNIRNRKSGLWDLVLETPGDTTILVKNAFEILEKGEASPFAQIIGANAFIPGRWQTFAIMYGNRGNIDAKGVPLWLVIGGDTTAEVELKFPVQPARNYQSIKSREGIDLIDYSAIDLSFTTDSAFGRSQPARVYPLYLPVVAAGKTNILYFRIKSIKNSPLELYTYTNKPLYVNPIKENVISCFYNHVWDEGIDADDLFEEGLTSVLETGESLVKFIADVTLPTDCIESIIDNVLQPGEYIKNSIGKPLGIPDPDSLKYQSDKEVFNAYDTFDDYYQVGSMIWSHSSVIARCAVDLLPQAKVAKAIGKTAAKIAYQSFKYINKINTKIDSYEEIADGVEAYQNLRPCVEAFKEGVDIASRRLNPVTSYDPNDKLGVVGSGSQGFIKDVSYFPYTIRFENMPTAKTAAQTVLIVDTLDTKVFDLTTLRLGLVSFSDTAYLPMAETTNLTDYIDLRPKKNIILKLEAKLNPGTGVLTWLFTTLDPQTMELTEDPFGGFLPPNKVSPQGEGSVFFTIELKKGLPTGTQVKNQAWIYFDTNPVIKTPIWKNTLDLTNPESKIQPPVALSEPGQYRLPILGNDLQSGIKQYEIWLSVNQGAYRLVSRTTEKSFLFRSHPDSVYTFYSIAVDSAGNREPVPVGFDAILDKVTGTESSQILGSIVLYPNPTQGQFLLTATLPSLQPVMIECLDMLGKKIYVKNIPTLGSQGELKTNIDISFLPPGVYMVALRQGEKFWCKKLILR